MVSKQFVNCVIYDKNVTQYARRLLSLKHPMLICNYIFVDNLSRSKNWRILNKHLWMYGGRNRRFGYCCKFKQTARSPWPGRPVACQPVPFAVVSRLQSSRPGPAADGGAAPCAPRTGPAHRRGSQAPPALCLERRKVRGSTGTHWLGRTSAGPGCHVKKRKKKQHVYN